MSAIFISHSNKDNAIAAELQARMKENHHQSLFLDFDPETGIEAGAKWEKTIYRKLRACKAVIAVCTDNSLASRWCFAEIALARMQGKPVFAVQSEPWGLESKMPEMLTENQLVDLRTNPNDGYQRLFRGLKEQRIEPADSWARDRSPYPGLAAFHEADAAVFFGREPETDRGLELLRSVHQSGSGGLVVVLGSSGSGKSSLVRAGLLPRLGQEPNTWIVVPPFRPGTEPLDELVHSISKGFGCRTADVAAELRSGKRLAELIRGLRREANRGDAPVLIVIDQFEELLDTGNEQSAKFLSTLRAGIEDDGSPLVVVATLRSDWLAAFQKDPQLARIEFHSLSLGPMPIDGLRRVIEGPAVLAEIDIEAGLVDLLLKDTCTHHALPLLAFTLRELWETRLKDEDLTLEAYKKTKGLHGSVAKAAEDLLPATLDSAQMDGLRSAFLEMARVNEEGKYARRRVKWEDLPQALHKLLRRFEKRRLLISSQDSGTPVVEIAHEALFDSWERLRKWLEDSREALLFRQQLRRATDLWEEGGRSQADLLRGPRLQRALDLRNSAQASLDLRESAFLQESWQNEQEEREEQKTQHRITEEFAMNSLARGLAFQANAIRDDAPERALNLAAEAVRATGDAGMPVSPIAESALRDLLCHVGGVPVTGDRSGISALALGRGGRWLAAGHDSGVVCLWSVLEGALSDTHSPGGLGAQVTSLAFTPGAQSVVSGGRNGVVALLPTDGSGNQDAPRVLHTHYKAVTKLVVDRNGRWLASASHDKTAALYPIDSSGEVYEVPRILSAHTDKVCDLAISPDGHWLVTAGADNAVFLWDLTATAPEARTVLLAGHQQGVNCVTFSADGEWLVSGGGDGLVARWSLAEPETEVKSLELGGSNDSILCVAISPDKHYIIAGTWGPYVLCWTDEDNFTEPIRLLGHTSSIRSIAVREDSQLLLTSSSRDNYALLWRLKGIRENPRPFFLRGEDSWINHVMFIHQTMVAASAAGSLRAWRTLQAEPAIVPLPGVHLNHYALSGDNSRLISASPSISIGHGKLDEHASLVSLSSKSPRIEKVGGHAAGIESVCMSKDGTCFALGGRDSAVTVHLEGRSPLRVSIPEADWIYSVALSNDKRWVVIGATGGPYLADVESDEPQPILLTPEQHTGIVRSIAFSHDDRFLASGRADGIGTLWHFQSGRPQQYLTICQDRGIWQVQITRDLRFMVTAGGDGLIRLWKLDTDPRGEPLILSGHSGAILTLALSEDGRWLVSGGEDVTARVWDLNSANPSAEVAVLRGHQNYIQAVAVNKDGSRVVTASYDGIVRLWTRGSAGKWIDGGILKGHSELVTLVAFQNHDSVLVTADLDGIARFWDLNIGSMLRTAARCAGRNLTDSEWEQFFPGREFRKTFPDSESAAADEDL